MYDFQFNTALNSAIMQPNTFDCLTQIEFAGNVNQSVYSPFPFAPPSSLSHLEDLCHVPVPFSNDEYYVMSNANNTGSLYMKRYLKPEERKVLCDIGYRVNDVYGNSAYLNDFSYSGGQCPGIQVAGINDGISPLGVFLYSTNVGSTIPISGILTNDFNTSSFECLEDLYNNGTPDVTMGTTFNYLANSPGLAVLRYIPVGSNANRGNITYIFILVQPVGSNCEYTSCNLIPNGQFESTITECGMGTVVNSRLNCWSVYTNSPDLFARNCADINYSIPNGTYSVPPSETWNNGANNNDHFLGMFSNTMGPYGEAIQVTLSSGLINGSDYLLKFWARVPSYNLPTEPFPLSIVVTQTPIQVVGSTFNSTDVSLTPVIPALVIPDVGEWIYIQQNFTYNGPSGYTNFIIGADPLVNPTSPSGKYLFMDDIELIPASSAVTFSPPAIICSNQFISDLSIYTNVQGGTFSGVGVTQNGTIFSFDPTLAGLGNQLITYSYTTNNGCNLNTYSTINVVNASIDLNLNATPSDICFGESWMVNASGAPTYTWEPGSLSGNSISVAPLTTTTYVVTGTSTEGCIASEEIILVVGNAVNINVNASSNIICQGSNTTISVSGADTYSWSPSSGLTSTTGSIVTATPLVTTTYTVTGTNSDGCTGTADITITVDNSLANFAATATDNILCPGETATLEATGAVSYTWNPGNLSSNPITVSPLSSTIYTVTGTSPFGCTANESINITVDNSINNLAVLSSENFICPNGSSTLTASGANTYFWEPGNFVGNPYVVSPASTTVYTVTGTSINGCVESAEITVEVNDNENTMCCLTSTLTLYDDQNSAQIGAIPSGSVINVNGTFTVNTNLSLVACTLRMAPDARIEVMSGFNFSLTDCLIFSCTEMWDGIYSNPGATVIVEGSRIEDAHYAIFSVLGGNYFLNNTTFNKNNIGLFVDGFSGYHPGIVKNCTFDCTVLNSPTIGSILKAPMLGEKSHFGIYGGGVSQINFGEVSAQANIFQNLEIGIGLIATKANIYRNNFYNIVEPYCVPLPPGDCPVIGWAIWASRSYLLVGDDAGLSHENNFRNCSNGIFLSAFCSFEIRKNNFTNILTPGLNNQYSKCIYARFGSLSSSPSYGEIEDNVFVNFEAGIYYEGNQMNYLHINRNRFGGFNSPNGTAIYLRQNQSHPVEIKNNIINFLPFMKGVYGIRVQNAVQSGNNVTIEQNTIKNVRHAIWTTNYDGINISDHNADFTSIGASAAGIYYPNTLPTVFSVGIKVENCPNTNISNNLIQKAMPNPTVSYTKLLYGISVETNGIGSTIVENEVKRLGKGLNFYGQPNAPLYVSCNAMYLNRTGLSLNNTYIGNQGSSSPLIAQDNQWTIPGNEITYWLGVELLGSSSSSSIWHSRMNTMPFFPNLSTQMNPDNSITPNIISGAPYNCSFGCANPPCLMVDGGKMIKKENPFNLLNNEEKQMIDIQMHKLLKNNPSFLTSGTPDDSIYVNYIDSLDNTNIGKIYRFSKQLEDGDTIASYNEILSVTPVMTAESNHKIVNEIYWRSWVHDIFEFSPADSAYLLSVAQQHPHQGGTAVYDARVMLGLDFYDYDEGDQQKSTTIEEEEISVLDEQGEIKFVLYPNPATAFINYRAFLGDQENAELIVYDLMGKPILSQAITNENLEGIIDIQEIALGMYTYRLFINKDPIEFGTIIIH